MRASGVFGVFAVVGVSASATALYASHLQQKFETVILDPESRLGSVVVRDPDIFVRVENPKEGRMNVPCQTVLRADRNAPEEKRPPALTVLAGECRGVIHTAIQTNPDAYVFWDMGVTPSDVLRDTSAYEFSYVDGGLRAKFLDVSVGLVTLTGHIPCSELLSLGPVANDDEFRGARDLRAAGDACVQAVQESLKAWPQSGTSSFTPS